MIKLLTFAAIMYVIYIMFFKNKKNINNDEQIDTMVECTKCGTFVSKDEAIISNGQYYCSKECVS